MVYVQHICQQYSLTAKGNFSPSLRERQQRNKFKDENNEDVYKIVRKSWQKDMRFSNDMENLATERSEIVRSKENIKYQEALGRRS